jgi:predicted RNA-binding protein with TRAM domain
MEPVWIAAAGGGLLVLLTALLGWRRRGGAGRSERAHDRAQEREPPVEIGENVEMGITEFTDHHTGKRVAVGKVEGFVVFTADVPGHVSERDAIRVTVTSFNRDRTSADATFVETI